MVITNVIGTLKFVLLLTNFSTAVSPVEVSPVLSLNYMGFEILRLFGQHIFFLLWNVLKSYFDSWDQ